MNNSELEKAYDEYEKLLDEKKYLEQDLANLGERKGNAPKEEFDKVKEKLRKVMFIGFIIGLIFNLCIYIFPKQIVSIFISKSSDDYKLFMEFAIDFCRIFLLVCALNSFEICSSIIIQSLGNVKKATMVSFTRQIILFIPLSLILCHFIGLYGALYAGPIADTICFIFVIFVFTSEYKKITR